MPGDDEERMFYSFNLGPVHFVSISTEFYYYVEYGTDQMVNQYRWLEQDLAEVSGNVKILNIVGFSSWIIFVFRQIRLVHAVNGPG
jgi:hypothetical protein